MKRQKWYAASVIMFFEFEDKKQATFHVWENVLLLRAAGPAAARRKAIRLAKQEEGPAEEALVLFGRPARRVFAGVRKVLSCAPALSGPTPIPEEIEDGSEATYSTFVVRGRRDLEALATGKPVRLLYKK